MSTEFAENIRRIAKGTNRKGALGEYQPRDPVLGGTVSLVTSAYNGVGETPTSTAPNSPNNQSDAGSTQDNQNQEDPNTFYQGGSGSESTGTEDSAQEQGSADIDDLMDGTDGSQTAPNPDGESPTGYDTTTSKVTGLTDADGNCFNVRMDGTFPTPDGWDDADTPPVIDGYETGFTWTTQNIAGYSGRGATAQKAVEDWDTEGEYSGLSLFNEISSTQQVWSVSSGALKRGGAQTTSMSVFKTSCTPSDTDIPNQDGEAYCPSTPPTEELWPEGDGCFVLSYKDGTFQTNQYDPNAPENWEPKSTVYSYEGGMPKYGMTGTANGGYMVYDTNSDKTPNSSGTAKVYDSQGRFTAAGNPTQQFMNQYLPK